MKNNINKVYKLLSHPGVILSIGNCFYDGPKQPKEILENKNHRPISITLGKVNAPEQKIIITLEELSRARINDNIISIDGPDQSEVEIVIFTLKPIDISYSFKCEKLPELIYNLPVPILSTDI